MQPRFLLVNRTTHPENLIAYGNVVSSFVCALQALMFRKISKYAYDSIVYRSNASIGCLTFWWRGIRGSRVSASQPVCCGTQFSRESGRSGPRQNIGNQKFEMTLNHNNYTISNTKKIIAVKSYFSLSSISSELYVNLHRTPLPKITVCCVYCVNVKCRCNQPLADRRLQVHQRPFTI